MFKTLKKGDDSGSGLESYDVDSIFVLDHCSTVGLFWKYDVLSASADCLDAVFKDVSMYHVLHGNRGITLDNCCPWKCMYMQYPTCFHWLNLGH